MTSVKQLLPAVVACALIAPGVASAQAAGGLKIGVVNFARLIQESSQAKASIKALEDEFAPRQRELVAKQNELKERQAKLQKDGQVMGAEERRNAENRFRDDERDLGRRQNAFLEDLNAKRTDELGKIQRDLLKQVQAFAVQKGYDLVIGEGVLYAAKSVDLTDQVLQAVQAAAKPAAGAKP